MRQKIKVLHVAEAGQGGVERYLETLLKFSNKQQVEDILVCSQNYDMNKFVNIASKVIQVNMTHRIDPKKGLFSIKRIRSLIKKYKPDIVYAHSSKAGALARIANIGLRSKCIYNPHGWAFNEVPKNFKGKIKNNLYKIIEKIAAPFCSIIICISDFEKKTAIRNRIAKENKLKIVYSGIDLENNLSKNIKPDIKFPKNAFVIGMVGRITETKAPDIFVKAAKKISKEIPNAYFILVGDGDLRVKIEQLIDSLGIKDRFVITGWVNNPREYMKIMDVGLLLSRWEGFGLVLPKYMYMKVPIVCTNVGGISDIIQNEINGLLVSSNDPRSVVTAVKRIYEDINLRNKLISNGYKIVGSRFDVKREVLQTEQIYKKILVNEF